MSRVLLTFCSLLLLAEKQHLACAQDSKGASCAPLQTANVSARSLIQNVATPREKQQNLSQMDALAEAGAALAEAGAALAEASTLEGDSFAPRTLLQAGKVSAPSLAETGVVTQVKYKRHAHAANAHSAESQLKELKDTSDNEDKAVGGKIVPCRTFFSKICKIEETVWSSFVSWNDVNVAFRICCTSAGHHGDTCRPVANEIFKDKHEDGDPDPTDEVFCDMLMDLGTAHMRWDEDRAAMNFQKVDFLQESSKLESSKLESSKLDNSRALTTVQTQRQKNITDQLMDQLSELASMSPELITSFLGGAAAAAGIIAHGATKGSLMLTQVPKSTAVVAALFAVSTHVSKCAP